jgi:hypothetical protein
MAKDYTKFKFEDWEKGIAKSRMVQKVLEHYVSSMDMNYEELKEQWWDDIQGGKGIIRKVSEIDAKNERNYYINAPITLNDGTKIAVCNQWGKENFSNFILHAGLLNYKIIADIEEENEVCDEELSQEKVPKVEEKSVIQEIVEGSINWKLPHAIAFVIRHTMLVDGEVIEGELNWMQVAFNEYDKQGIAVRDVWDDVDSQSQFFWKMGKHNTLLVNSINFLAEHLDNSQKSRLIKILMQICVQDNLIAKNEYVTLLLVAKNLYDGAAYPIRQVLNNAGITIEE